MVGSNPARSPGNLDEALEGGKCIALNQCQPRHAVAADDPNFDVLAARRRRHNGYQRTLWEIDEACRLIWGLEAVPFEKDAGVFEVHQIMLAMNGTYILENINTAELAKDKAYEFMFVLGHNKYQGAVQSMINPVAIR